uniref:Glycylpeptide N-tetradecanoyltransferase n=1 Tax=Pithovirus LCPAC302 TaxID=2506593 RepID=A0A481Z8K1_9VIRU|nr:MAG: hypothetical protein LCPAC302_00590 [Pithovirus LCPAC302]
MSGYWSDMFIDKNNQCDTFIISKENPIEYDNNNNNIKLYKGIKLEEYEEVSEFISKNNKMSSDNTTLLPVDEIIKLLNFDTVSILMRGKNNRLIGVIISVSLPIMCNKKEIIIHGCTTFLNVHSKLRGHGLCMALIRELISYGYQDNIYCDYHTVPFSIGSNSFRLKAYYRPINLFSCKRLGFIFPDHDNPRKLTKTRLKYRTAFPKNCKIIKVDLNNHNIESSLKYYHTLIKNKKFSFYPDNNLWLKWTKTFPTFVVYIRDVEVGIISMHSIYCLIDKTQEEGVIGTPVICNGDMNIVLPVLLNLAKEEFKYDLVYFHSYGDITEESMIENNCIEADSDMWFSLYNNRIKIKSSDISVPLL